MHPNVVRTALCRLWLCLMLAMLSALVAPSTLTAEAAPEGLIHMKSVGDSGEGYFIIEGKPGQTYTVTVQVRNMSADHPASATLFVTDAVVAQGGGMGTVTPDKAPRRRVGGWFEQPYELTVQLKPDESRNVPLRFTIPPDARTGDHVGAIVLYKLLPPGEAAKIGNDKAQIVVNKAYSHSIAVHVKIPGPAERRLEFSAFKPLWNGADLFYELTFANTGNAIEKATGTIELFAQDGFKLAETKGRMDSVYPDAQGAFVFKAPDRAKAQGTYKARAVWHFADAKTAERTFEFAIGGKEARTAQLVELATANPDKKYAPNAIVLDPNTLLRYSLTGLILVMLAVSLISLWIRRRSGKKRRDPPSGPSLSA